MEWNSSKGRWAALSIASLLLIALGSCQAPFGMDSLEDVAFDTGLDAGVLDAALPGLNLPVPSPGGSGGGAFAATCAECESYDGYVDTRFPNANGAVHALAEHGGQIYLGGNFDYVGYPAGRVAAIDSGDGALLDPLPMVDNGQVLDAVPHPDGGWIVAGSFGNVDGQPRQRLAWIQADGSVNLAWGPASVTGTGAAIRSLAIHDGKVYVGGTFSAINSVPRENLAAFDLATGNLEPWTADPVNGTVHALIIHADRIYIGGDFSTIGPGGRNGLGALNMDGTVDTAFINNPAIGSKVFDMAIGGPETTPQLFVTGNFIRSSGGGNRISLMSIDLGSGLTSGWAPTLKLGTLNGNGYAVIANANRLYVGGNFDEVNGQPMTNLVAFDIDPMNLQVLNLVTDWNPAPDAPIQSLELEAQRLFVGGAFKRIAGEERLRLAAFGIDVNGVINLNDTWRQDIENNVLTIRYGNGHLLIGGDFTMAGGGGRGRLASVDVTSGMLTSWNPRADDRVYDFALYGNTLYVGGHFSFINDELRGRLASFDLENGDILTLFDGDANGPVEALHIRDDMLYVGGDFGAIGGGQIRERLAAFELEFEELDPWAPGIALEPVKAIASFDDKLYVGALAEAGCLTAFSRTLPMATPWLGDCGVFSGVAEVTSLHIDNNHLFVGGQFDSFDGESRSNLIAIDLTTSVTSDWNPDPGSRVEALTSGPQRIFVGGSFMQIDARPRSRLAAFDRGTRALNPWLPSVDNGLVYRILVSSDQIFVGGGFGTVDGMAAPNFVALAVGDTGCECSGEPCGEDADCSEGVCIDGLCKVDCTTQTDCQGTDPCNTYSCDASICIWGPDLMCTSCNVPEDCTDPGTTCVDGTCTCGANDCRGVCNDLADCATLCDYDLRECTSLTVINCSDYFVWNSGPNCGCIASTNCDDDNECTDNVCDGDAICSNPPKATGTHCATGFCDGAGKCVECLDAADCPNDGNSCTESMCDLVTSTCVHLDNGSCECQTDQDCADGNACTTSSCDPGTNTCVSGGDAGSGTGCDNYGVIALGFYQTCTLSPQGKVKCTGSDATADPLTLFQSIAVGRDHVCGIKLDDAIECWGGDASGQVSNAPAGTGWKQITSGDYFSCAIDQTDLVTCWGVDDHGQVSSASIDSFREISAGSKHVCGLLMDSTVGCWGANVNNVVTNKPTGVFEQLISGLEYSCVLHADATVYCWGHYFAHQVNYDPPTTEEFLRIGPGRQHACGILLDGTAYCWGRKAEGQTSPPAGDYEFQSISGGVVHSCGLTTSGALVCWGTNNGGTIVPRRDGFCETGVCYECTINAQCDDGEPCTTTSCDLTTNTCSREWGSGCLCEADSDCEDFNPCTDNICNGDGTCSNLQNGACLGCSTDADCDDGDVCTHNTCGVGWQSQNPTPTPSPRDTPAMVYDSARGVSVLFGGNDGAYKKDTWTWNGVGWSLKSPPTSPEPRFLHRMSYDEDRAVTVLFGGRGTDDPPILGDTWEWNGMDWTKKFPVGAPFRRIGHSMAYDASEGVTVLFGGWVGVGEDGSPTMFGDTWGWDGENENWVLMHDWDDIVPNLSPVPRRGSAMAYDSARGVITLFGGTEDINNANNHLGDTWEWDGVTWQKVHEWASAMNDSPRPRRESAMVYDAARGVTILLGGRDDSDTPVIYYSDVWEWDGTTWKDVTDSSAAPPARYGHTLAWDASRGMTVLFGAANLTDGRTWEWTGAETTCQTVDTGKCGITQISAGGDHVCMLTPNGTINCWGGDNTFGQRSVPPGQYRHVASGSVASCAITTDDAVVCWGSNTLDPPEALTTGDIVLRQISVGDAGACVIQEDSTVLCWGDAFVTAEVGGFQHISVGAEHACGLRTNGTISCWGTDSFSTGKANAPPGTFVNVSAGDEHSCGIRDNGEIECWGTGLLDGLLAASFPPSPVQGQEFVRLSGGLGYTNSCVLDQLGNIDCWGNLGFAPAGTFPTTDTRYVYVSVGFDFTCALTVDDDIHCWGPDPADPMEPPSACTSSLDCESGVYCTDGFCLDACTGVICPVEYTCYGGTCFPDCFNDLDCTDLDHVCYDGRCALDACSGITCSGSEICYGGTCFAVCTDTEECDPDHACYDGRCTPDACHGVACSTGYECHGGTCFQECTDDEACDEDNFLCYDGRCTLDGDACYDVQCSTGYFCSGGTCFQSCTEDEECDEDNFLCYLGACFPPCELDDTCDEDNLFCFEGRCSTDACAGVLCSEGYSCHGGTCFQDCTEDEACDEENFLCFDGRCALDACSDVQCSTGYFCSGGTCFQTCTEDEQCDEDNFLCYLGACYPPCNASDYCDEENLLCFEGRCSTDACAGVLCSEGYSCHGGTCFQDCTEDEACDEENFLCFDGRCALDACSDVQCSTGYFCSGGTCFQSCTEDEECDEDNFLCYLGACFDGCTSDDECPELAEACYNQRCATNPCAGIVCNDGFTCVEGTCLSECSTDLECDEDHHCYKDYCRQNNCNIPDEVRCHPGQTCHMGTCFVTCGPDAPCDEDHICYDGRCATDSCAALLENYDSEDSPHIYRVMNDHWPTLAQRSMPWRRPRPIIHTAELGVAIGSAVADGIPAAKKGRVVLFLNEATRLYSLMLLHGASDAGQGSAGATYSVRYFDLDSPPSVLQAESVEVSHVLTDGTTPNPAITFHHHQLQLRSGDGTATGLAYVALGSFPADKPWTVRISAAFRGDIDEWEIYSAETNEWLDLDLAEELELSNVAIHESVRLSQEVGVRECQPTNDGVAVEGICGRGTTTTCRYGNLTCGQTVARWPFEVCDGRDTNCDGEVDNVDAELGMRVPMVYVRQEGHLDAWTRWATVDGPRPPGEASDQAFDFLNYARHGSYYGEGSTDMRGVGGFTSIQSSRRSLALFHRDLDKGIISMPLAHGARVTGDFPLDAEVQTRLEFAYDETSPYYDYSDLLFASWYDDWILPAGPYGDEVPRTISYEQMHLRWNVRGMDVGGSPGREADSAIMQFIWQTGGDLMPLRFDVALNLPDSFDEWRLYRPYTALRYLDPSKPLEVQIRWTTLEDSVCMSATADGSCAVSYVCGDGGVLSCPAATEESCTGCRDHDGDGYLGFHPTLCPDGDDCNDDPDDPRAPFINPGAKEVCDGTDTNCDGYVDAIGPAAYLESCPDDQDLCGPEECTYRMACACSGDACECREGLNPDEYTSGRQARWMTVIPDDRDDMAMVPDIPSPDQNPSAACSASTNITPFSYSRALWVLLFASLLLIRRRSKIFPRLERKNHKLDRIGIYRLFQ
ncbi:MAG: hypothetical protein ACNA8W_00720 [Bradymonadaceae bacterium]